VNTEPNPGHAVREGHQQAPGFKLLTAIWLISAAAIGYEILLVRLLSIVQWHHFAWMVISLALLGYGASGTAVALARHWLDRHFSLSFTISALVFSITLVACFSLGQRIPFNALEVAWNPRQFGYLALMYLVFMVPFFFAACCIGLAFTCRRKRVDRIYLFDLLGAGTGAIVVLALLFVLEPQQALVLLSALGLTASVVTTPAFRPFRWRLRGLQMVWLVALVALAPAGRIELHISEFKGLSQALRVIETRVLEQSSSPLGLLTVVESPAVPFRHAPGLSFAAKHLPPDQLGIFTDGDSISVITRFQGDIEELAWLDDVTAALPYYLLKNPDVLVLGAGAGLDVLLALRHGATHIDAVELNPAVTKLVNNRFREYSGALFDDERVTLHIREARGFVARSSKSYDLIQLALTGSFAASGAGVQALNENHLYTVEAMRQYLQRLRPGGMLAITHWLKLPPRESLKLVATLAEAIRQSGVDNPDQRIAVIRNWNTATLLAKNGEFGPAEAGAITEFAHARFFDTAYYPGIQPGQANRFNRLDSAWLHDGAIALLGEQSDQFMNDYKFHLEPANDDSPYFHHFFEWRVLPEVLELRERGGAGLIEWSYLVLVATLVQALAAGLVLILLPLASVRRQRAVGAEWRMGTYFFLLGLAFLFVEMAFIQKFTLFLSHPLFSVAVVLAGFLVFAGLGSGYSEKFASFTARYGFLPVRAAVGFMVSLGLAYLLGLPWLFEQFMGQPDAVRILLSLALIAPLAFFMGMPFPLGLKQLAVDCPEFIPWAWGINGFASVLSTSLALLLALKAGFTAVLLLALLLYIGAAYLSRIRS
jgi:SAM-dependent methyltransferase